MTTTSMYLSSTSSLNLLFIHLRAVNILPIYCKILLLSFHTPTITLFSTTITITITIAGA